MGYSVSSLLWVAELCFPWPAFVPVTFVPSALSPPWNIWICGFGPCVWELFIIRLLFVLGGFCVMFQVMEEPLPAFSSHRRSFSF